MRTQLPDVARPAAGFSIILRQPVLFRVAGLLRLQPIDQAVDLGDREACQADVEVEIDGQQLLQFLRTRRGLPYKPL